MKRLIHIILFYILFLQPMFSQSCSLDSEGFEGTSNASPPAGWQRINSYIDAAFPNSGTTHAGFNTLGDILIVESLTCPGQICFFWRASGATSNYDIDIDWSTDGGTTWNNAHKISLNGAGSPTTYQQTCVDLPENFFPAPFTAVLIRFNQSRRVSGSFYLDDVCIDAGTCSVTPSEMRISLPLACIQTGLPFSVEVCATDALGNISSAYNGNITLSHNAGAGSISGTLSGTAVNGCFQFNNLSLNTVDNVHQLSATDGSISGTSSVFSALAQCPTVDTLRVMSYNLLNFPGGRDDCGTNTVIPARWDTLAMILNYVKPDILMVCELQNAVGADSILNRALNINGISNYSRASFVVNQSPGGTNLNNILFYNSAKMSLYRQTLLRTHQRDISYYTLLMNDPGLASGNDSTFLDVFVGHLDAAGTDSLSRKRSCDTLRHYIDTAASARNVLFGGDFNFYRSTESGYLTLLSGTYPLFDPINAPGEWTANAAFASVHTQSTRASSTTSMDCGALGGMDDRFDFILASSPIMNGSGGIEYIPGTYLPLSNSGNLFNRSINDPINNSAIPAAVKNALFHMSDHLPVIMDLEVRFPTTLLALNLLDFKGESMAEGNLLNWKISTADGLPRQIILQSSIDGIYFREEARFINDGTETDFQFLDQYPGPLRYYRLKISRGGESQISGIIALEHSENQSKFVLYPNPATDVLNIAFEQVQQEGQNVFQISNALGQIVLKEELPMQYAYSFDISNLKPGYYLLKISHEDGKTQMQPFVKR